MKRSTSMATRLAWLTAMVLVASSLVGPLPAIAQSAAELAIQDTIQRGNQAQVQAVLSHDASVVSDAAVGPYAQQLMRTNQGLIDAGVIAIELVTLEWGPISIGGSSAPATPFETWRPSSAQRPTEFARGPNIQRPVPSRRGPLEHT